MTAPRTVSLVIVTLLVLGFGRGALAQTIPISSIDELYSAVNDPANAGATLALAPGTYLLSVSDGAGVARANGGRIELQADMSLRGLEGDRTAVVIDAVNLPASSFPQTVNGINLGPNAAVRLGRGRNTLEWLTVRDAWLGQANIDTGLQPLDPGPAVVRIAHVASTGSTRGLNVLNFGTLASGQTIEAEIVDSLFYENIFNLSEGVRLGNFQGAQGSTVNARMSGNVFWGQMQGRLIVNNRASNSTINVESSGNLFHDNGAGTIIVGGLSSNNTRADGNIINVDVRGDRFISNTRHSDFDNGGVVVLGSENVSPATGGGSGNVVHVRLWGCRMSENAVADLTGIAARWVFPATEGLSANNRVTIEQHGADGSNGKWPLIDWMADTVPEGPAYGNQVVLIRK